IQPRQQPDRQAAARLRTARRRLHDPAEAAGDDGGAEVEQARPDLLGGRQLRRRRLAGADHRDAALHRTTMFTSLPGTTISLTTSRPSTWARAFGAACASALRSSVEASAGACTRSRTLPLTWTTTSIVSVVR